MHSFLIITSGHARSPEEIAMVAGAAVGRLAFESSDEVVWSSRSKRTWFLGWQANTHVLEVGSRWQADEDGLLAFAGWPLPSNPREASETWAAALSREVEGRSAGSCQDHLRGVYALVRLDLDGDGFVAPDPYGVAAPFLGGAGDTTVISDRADLVAAALGVLGVRPERDVDAMGWLPYFSLLVGEQSGYRGVETLPQFSYLELRDGHANVRKETSVWDWPTARSGERPDSESLLAELEANLRRIACFTAGQRTVMLSGGKDSRLVLALALRAGLQDEFLFRSVGLERQSDAIVARRLARRFGLDLERIVPPQIRFDAETLDARLRAHVFQTGGMLGGWDLKGATLVGNRVEMNGLFGELMRSNYAKRRIAGVEDLKRFFFDELYLDPARLLLPDARESYRRRLEEWVDAQLDAGVGAADVPDRFYLEQRIRRWIGASRDGLQASPTFFPLLTPLALTEAVRAGHERRRIDALHFELIGNAAPELLEVPLADASWAPSLTDSKVHPPSPVRGAPGVESWQNLNWPTIVNVVRERALVDAANPIFSIVDRNRVERALATPQTLDLTSRVALLALATSAIWLGGGEEPTRYPAERPTPALVGMYAAHVRARGYRARIVELEDAFDLRDEEPVAGARDGAAGSRRVIVAAAKKAAKRVWRRLFQPSG